jgi:TPR repeat protein
MTMKTRFWLSGWIVLGMFAMTPAAFADDAPASASSSASAQGGEKIYGCSEGYEDLLPGEYYACRARYHFQRKHFRQTVEMLKEAAHWANKDAQYSLGLLFFNGDMPDVPMNRPLGLAWLALAAERKSNPTYVRTYTEASLQSSSAEIRAAGELWQKMRLEYGDKVAGLRALRRFNRGIRPLEETANYGGMVWLNGYSPYPEEALAVVNRLHAVADHVFDGLQGTVTVGSLKVENSRRPREPASDTK